jgi:hypothetical protein
MLFAHLMLPKHSMVVIGRYSGKYGFNNQEAARRKPLFNMSKSGLS